MPTSDFVLLQSNRFLLRPIVESDLEQVYNGLSHPDIIRYYGVSYNSLEETKAQMRFFAELEHNGTGIWWAICSLDQTTFYGAGGLNSLIREHNKAEIGLWLLKEYWGQGIMTEIIPLICQYGFKNLGLHRIEGLVESENFNCKKALSKLDFQYEGTMVDCEIKNGKYISLDIYALLYSIDQKD